MVRLVRMLYNWVTISILAIVLAPGAQEMMRVAGIELDAWWSPWVSALLVAGAYLAIHHTAAEVAQSVVRRWAQEQGEKFRSGLEEKLRAVEGKRGK